MAPADTTDPSGFDFDDAVLGAGLPAAAEAALHEAGRLRGADPVQAMAQLMLAQALAPGHPAVLIAFYRHHFYGHRLAAARDIARRVLAVGGEALGLPSIWRQVAPAAGARRAEAPFGGEDGGGSHAQDRRSRRRAAFSSRIAMMSR